MAYYDTLIAEWKTLSGTTAQKLAAVNALTVAGPNQDVSAATVKGAWYATGAWSKIRKRAILAANNVDTSEAGLAALSFVELANAGGTFLASNPAILTSLSADLDALVAAGDLQASDKTLALSFVTPQISWLVANNYLVNGAPRGITDNDLVAAGGLV
jgi:hypothetical protein